jgi:hypothetical protein
MAVWHTCFEFELAGSGMSAANCNGRLAHSKIHIFKKTLNGHYNLQRAATPDQIIQLNSLQRAVGPKRQKKHFVASGLISRPILGLCFL